MKPGGETRSTEFPIELDLASLRRILPPSGTYATKDCRWPEEENSITTK